MNDKMIIAALDAVKDDIVFANMTPESTTLMIPIDDTVLSQTRAYTSWYVNLTQSQQ